MKYVALILILFFSYQASHAQDSVTKADVSASPPKVSHIVENPVPLIKLKDVALYSGKYVRIIDVVYAHKMVDTLELLAVGGIYPNQALTIIVYGKALAALKADDVDGKTIMVGGIVVADKENKDPEIYINNPQLINIIPKH
ncbi:hypothetical protein [Mucilaginibacter sp. FT3.2]|uniref:hypothetical protein n=1 Tax=Mucilaginibacter sp. FT3.2 TaxID=2723090 RepID=UPI0016160FEE|nr:hypothetical protein [Mucilaginibacter sp. FT3.2]MBB6230870.1 hypothetical protein [Mucilaginibacter sp. FT3.2]